MAIVQHRESDSCYSKSSQSGKRKPLSPPLQSVPPPPPAGRTIFSLGSARHGGGRWVAPASGFARPQDSEASCIDLGPHGEFLGLPDTAPWPLPTDLRRRWYQTSRQELPEVRISWGLLSHC